MKVRTRQNETNLLKIKGRGTNGTRVPIRNASLTNCRRFHFKLRKIIKKAYNKMFLSEFSSQRWVYEIVAYSKNSKLFCLFALFVLLCFTVILTIFDNLSLNSNTAIFLSTQKNEAADNYFKHLIIYVLLLISFKTII